MTLQDLEFLYDLKREGIKLGLEVMREFSSKLGDRHREFGSFHVAGTNGKGSVSCFIYNILSQKYNSGLYTSPHLVDFNERILSGRSFIPDSYIENFISSNRNMIETLREKSRNPTFFETTTLMAFSYFADTGAKYAAIEVGLGGRLDSTNIITPIVSVITSIGYEHADKLGTSLTDIATEKAGIIKPGVPVVVSEGNAESVSAIKKIAIRNGSRMIQTDKSYKVSNAKISLDGTSFDLESPSDRYHISTDLVGDFQIRNAVSAVAAMESAGLDKITSLDIENGIFNSRWPARMEILRKEPTVMVDCAHNPPAMTTLVGNYRKLTKEKPLLVVGIMKDKDIYGILSRLSELSDSIIFTTPDEPERAADPSYLKRISDGMFTETRVIADPVEAYSKSLDQSRPVLVTGSMYLVGIIKKMEKSDMRPFK